MRKPQSSIRSAMVVVLLGAIGLAALKDKIVQGTGVVYAIMACVVLAALLGAILLRGGKQVVSIALAVFMTGYLLHTVKYGTLRPPYLILSAAFDRYGKLLGPTLFGFPNETAKPPILDFFRQAINTFLATLVTVFGSMLAQTRTARVDSQSPED